jgi:hypothetical protein
MRKETEEVLEQYFTSGFHWPNDNQLVPAFLNMCLLFFFMKPTSDADFVCYWAAGFCVFTNGCAWMLHP